MYLKISFYFLFVFLISYLYSPHFFESLEKNNCVNFSYLYENNFYENLWIIDNTFIVSNFKKEYYKKPILIENFFQLKLDHFNNYNFFKFDKKKQIFLNLKHSQFRINFKNQRNLKIIQNEIQAPLNIFEKNLYISTIYFCNYQKIKISFKPWYLNRI